MEWVEEEEEEARFQAKLSTVSHKTRKRLLIERAQTEL